MNFKKEHGFIKGAIQLASNPYAIAGAGAIWGVDKYQKNPEVADYLFKSEGGQERISTHLALGSLSKKMGVKFKKIVKI